MAEPEPRAQAADTEAAGEVSMKSTGGRRARGRPGAPPQAAMGALIGAGVTLGVAVVGKLISMPFTRRAKRAKKAKETPKVNEGLGSCGRQRTHP